MRKIAALAVSVLLLAGCAPSVEEGENWTYVEIDGMDCLHFDSNYHGSIDCDWSMRTSEPESRQQLEAELNRLLRELEESE